MRRWCRYWVALDSLGPEDFFSAIEFAIRALTKLASEKVLWL